MIDKSTRILVTGASGFLGQNLLSELKSCGFKNIFSPARFCVDLIYQDDIVEYLKVHKIECVIHLAGVVGGLNFNKKYPSKIGHDNLVMGVNLLDAVADLRGFKKFILIGTTCSYAAVPKTIPFKESELFSEFPEQTNATYGYSKRMLSLLLKDYAEEYGFEAVTLVPTNLYGIYDHFDLENSHVIPALIRKFEEAEKSSNHTIYCWGDGLATRDFLYAEDAARAIRLALETNFPTHDIINIGSGREISIQALVETIKVAGGYRSNIQFNGEIGNGQLRRVLDINKAKNILGWLPTTSLIDGLKMTIDWYRRNRNDICQN